MQLQLLSYRKEDIMDLLMSLKSMQAASGAKKKTESLENELLKIDSELFELEKKYGEFRVRKPSNFVEPEKPRIEPASSFGAVQVIEEAMPAVENSSLVEKTVEIDGQAVEMEVAAAVQKRSKKQVQDDIEELERRALELEALTEEAAANEEYDKAEEYQEQLDDINENQLPKLRTELSVASDEMVLS